METLKPLDDVQAPDVRNKLFVMRNVSTGEERPRVLADFHRDAAFAELTSNVPPSVRSEFAKAQNLAVYAWFFYPFHMSAELQAYACIELGLRERLKPKKRDERGFKRMLERAVKHGLIRDEGFRLFPAPPASPRTVPVGRNVKSVKSYSEVLVETLPAIRNDLAHGATTLHEGSPITLRICADVINQLFETDHELPESAPEPLTSDEIEKWLTEHIPYRVVAAISMSQIEQEWEPGPLVLLPSGLKSIGFNYAALQGRQAAIRWLIEFIGVKKSRAGNHPEQSDAVTSRDRTDCGIQLLPGGIPHPVDGAHEDAIFLANVWQGCSQAILHPTKNTNHFDVEHPNLNRAAAIIVRYLQTTVYGHAGRQLHNVIAEYSRARLPAP